jgi:hypothetical protein
MSKAIATAAFVMLAGCVQLSPEDRATLNDTRVMAMQARDQAAKAAQEAANADASCQRADRMFMQSQKK